MGKRLHDWLIGTWYGDGSRGRWLLPLAWLFAGASALRRRLYEAGVFTRYRSPRVVVIVGNVTVGGAGKTPFVIWLAGELERRGLRVGIAMRGYKGAGGGARRLTDVDSASDAGDEPWMIRRRLTLPVAVAARRAEAVRLLEPDCDVVVCDDGLQHYALARTVEIAAVDGARGLGDGMMLPAGPLREPPSRLASVDAVVTLVDDAGFALSPDARATQMTHEALQWRNLKAPDRVADFSGLRPGELHAIAGIANPDRFFDTLRRQGLAPACHAFPDHHPFVPGDLAFEGAHAILMTEKDAVKCARFADERMWCLPIRARIDPRLVALVEDRIRGRQIA